MHREVTELPPAPAPAPMRAARAFNPESPLSRSRTSPRLPTGLFAIALIGFLAGCAADSPDGVPSDSDTRPTPECIFAEDCLSGDCINGRCVAPGEQTGDGSTPGPGTGPDVSGTPDPRDTSSDEPGTTGRPDPSGEGATSIGPGTGPGPGTGEGTDPPPPTDLPPVVGVFSPCRTSADCPVEGANCVTRLLDEPGDESGGVVLFPEDPSLGICTRNCSPILGENDEVIGRDAVCDQIEVGGEIVDWQCQVVAVVGEDWRTARAASVCRPEIRAADDRTGTCFGCSDDANCADGLCVDLGLGGHVDRRCAGFCDPSAEDPCGVGFACESRTGASGSTADVCVPVTGTCTSCVDRDGDGHGIGACDGRDCDDANPLRYEGNTEVCNGLDSNCDGTVDTGFSSGADAEGAAIYDSLLACGACDQPCPTRINNTTYACEPLGNTFACVPSCATGYSTCGAPLSPDPEDAPVCAFNTRIDPSACGEECIDCIDELGSQDVFCDQGTCRFSNCPGGTASCDNPGANLCETDITSTVAHCGACDNNCDALANTDGTSCDDRQCVVEQCAEGWGNCNGNTGDGCETNLLTTAAHCGQCGAACAGTATCSDGTCTCTGFQQTYCPGRSLIGGGPGTGGGCFNLNTDNNNCGSCGNRCSGGKTCQNGQCRCPSGQTDCGGTCVNTSTDPRHCGSCNNACRGWDGFGDDYWNCSNGFCQPDCDPCPPGEICPPCFERR